jgi:hypothetical protein
MTEIDRFLRASEMDPYTHRAKFGYKKPSVESQALSIKTQSERVAEQLRSVIVLTFNEKKPAARLAFLCGRDERFWQNALNALERGKLPQKSAVKLLTTALRSHIAGLREHLIEMDQAVIRVTDSLDNKALWQNQESRSRRRTRATPAQS